MADPYILWVRFTEPNLGRVEWVKSRLDMCQISKIGSSFAIRRWEPPWFPPWRGPIISQASGASWSIFGGSTMFSFVDIFYLWIYQWCVVSWFNIRCAHHLFDHWVAQLCLHQTWPYHVSVIGWHHRDSNIYEVPHHDTIIQHTNRT